MLRRDLTLGLLRATGAFAVAGFGWSRAVSAALRATPSQTEGPFYPVRMPAESDGNLIAMGGRAMANGTPLKLSGRVLDTSGNPLAGARVEIWQCDSRGVYDHPQAPETERFDANFQGFGATGTDAEGRYRFTTIVPTIYPGRTPHIHAKVFARGREVLTTQLYIEGHPKNAGDFLFRRLVRFAGGNVPLMRLEDDGQIGDRPAKATTFDFVIKT